MTPHTSLRRPPRLRVLIVAINYEPEPTGSAPYTTRLAKHLAAQHDVRVITGMPHYPEWRYKRLASSYESNPAVHRYAHFVPHRPTSVGRALYEFTWLFSAMRGLTSSQFDLVISAIPSLSGGLLALLAGRRSKCAVGVVFHDLVAPGATQSGVAGGAVARVAGRLEALIARRANQVAVVCEDFRPYLENVGVPASQILRFRNWGRLGEAKEGIAETRKRFGWALNDHICLHAGNMGQKQGLENAVVAASILQGEGVRFVFAGDGNDRENLVRQSRELQVENVSFLPLQPSGIYESMLAAADILLLNQRPTVTEMSIPSKLTAYFSAGRPIVAAVAANSAAARELLRSKAGIRVNPGDPKALAEAIRHLRIDSSSAADLGANGVRYASEDLSSAADLVDYDEFIRRLVGTDSQSGEETSRQPRISGIGGR